MSRIGWGMAGSLLLLVVLVCLLPSGALHPRVAQDGVDLLKPSNPKPLVVYCAASNRVVMEAIRADFERDTGIAVQVQYGASQTLLSSLELSREGDLYLPADDSYLNDAQEHGLIDRVYPLAQMHVVAVSRRDRALKFASLEELLGQRLRIVQALPEAAAVGKLTRSVLETSHLWESLADATESFKSNVNEVANDVQLGAADVGFIFDAMLKNYPELEATRLPELESAVATIAVATVTTSNNIDQARGFADYLSDPELGLRQYAAHGFDVLPKGAR